MFCRFCGKELPEGARFCNNCGRIADVMPLQQAAPQETYGVVQIYYLFPAICQCRGGDRGAAETGAL